MALAIGSAAASSLAPGFRFHPTDEELVRYYLTRKVCGKPFRFDAISDVDVYKVEPWDLPGLSRLKTRDLEWYFFSVLDKKCGNSSRTNRATEKGYWKTTGKDRAVHHRSQQVGMKKTLVYHSGRAPKGERTNWVMHEYRLMDQELQNAGHVQNAFVLCRIFHKSGSGPKNGEKYGAPFVEEEWEDDDELVLVPKQEDHTEKLPVDEDSYLNANEIEQILGTDMPREVGPLPLTFDEGNNVSCADISATVTNDPRISLLDHVGGSESQADRSDRSKLFDQAVQNELDLGSVNHEYIGEPDDTMNFDMDYLLDEPYFDAITGDLSLDDSLFFEANDLKHPVESDPGLDMLDEYLSFSNSDFDNLQHNLVSVGSEQNILPDSSLTLKNVNDQTHQVIEASQAFEGPKDDIASSSKKDMASFPFMKKASYMLGNISAPPAFASEFPTKYLASEALGSTHVTSGMIRISSNVSFGEGAVDLSLGKHAQLNIVLSFGVGQRGVNHPHEGGKANSRNWFYCVFLWILVLSLSFKIGSLICPRSLMS
ncbi:NAC domain-containing protein 78-like [Cynara cardunculus var. scolymus]|uniref:NAC domain-containing protein 78-like n=1 Tax=Cynara cardunculus var. scolymus TaxID=59895 RepID=UPI000D624C54|nr:NAC domain-containing protein 78-like [Cynara cardunculus var. scolymus]